jgi:hypothetical protein
LVSQYFTIASMMPIALAAREAYGPAEMVFTRTPYLRPASNASTRVSLSSAAFAELIPPPYPGMARSLAIYVSEAKLPLCRIIGPNARTIDTSE